MKPSDPGLLFVGRILITDSMLLVVIQISCYCNYWSVNTVQEQFRSASWMVYELASPGKAAGVGMDVLWLGRF